MWRLINGQANRLRSFNHPLRSWLENRRRGGTICRVDHAALKFERKFLEARNKRTRDAAMIYGLLFASNNQRCKSPSPRLLDPGSRVLSNFSIEPRSAFYVY